MTSTFRLITVAAAAVLLSCRAGGELPPEAGRDGEAPSVSDTLSAPPGHHDGDGLPPVEWPHLPSGQPCEVTWLSPEPGPRMGNAVTVVVEVHVAVDTELDELLAWSYSQLEAGKAAPAVVLPLPQPGRFQLDFALPEDGPWSLCASCIQSDGLVGDSCSDGWLIDNVAPSPPANFRRAD